MGIPANPPPQSRLPDKILNDDELRGYFVAQQEDLYRLWLRSGGGTDSVSGIILDIEAINIRFDAIELRLDLIEARLTYLEGTLVVTAVDYQTEGNQTVICTDTLTITMDDDPLDKDLVSIKAINGDEITINGNGETIDGEATVTIRANKINKVKAGLTMRYSSSLPGWSLV